MDLSLIEQQTKTIVHDVVQLADLSLDKLLVIGCSTSEVLGQHIGKAGSEAVADTLYRIFWEASQLHGFHLVFQCCEHLNRALVMERATMNMAGLEEVTVVPVPSAGGAMAACAYRRFRDPVVVEHVRADAGIDIGDTFIGMHLKHVAVPIRPSMRAIGAAHVTAAMTRPKLIGGARAMYQHNDADNSCS